MANRNLRPKISPKSEFWKEKRKKRKKKGVWKKRLILFFLALFLIISLSVLMVFAWLSKDLPNPDQLLEREIAQTTTIYDRTGEHVLYEIFGDEKRTLILLDNIPKHVIEASIAIEDKNFYKHRGFSVWAIARTLITNILYGKKAGGSTLTQQFVKNAVLGPEKKYTRKIKELVLAQRIEKKFTKDEILQMYLNEIPYGSNAYGIEAASQKYFGKSVKDINVAEAALLAALPQAPSRYSPYGPNKDLLLGRKDYILNLMQEQGYINEQEKNAALTYEIKFKAPEADIKAPHFVMYIRALLAEKYGEKNIEQGGYKILTTIDWSMQELAEKVIKEKLDEYGENYNASNASLVAIDPKTGQILSMVGSYDYFNNEIDGQVNVSTRPRQPGSSLKPLVYASLFELGYTPNTILYDTETNFSTNPAEPYIPKNYNNEEKGPVNIREALATSLNIPAVKAIYLSDIKNVLNLAEKMGYDSFSDRSRFGLSLVLGGGEVKLLKHVNAYSAFAREGLMHDEVGVLKIFDKNGDIVEEYQESEKRVLSENSARMINSILSDNDARTPAFGSQSFLNIANREIAAKTGTTNDYHDAWTIGYTPSVVVGVWVGNSNNDAMKRGAGGSTVAAPIWNRFMSEILKDQPKEIFKKPEIQETGKSILDGIIEKEFIKIDSISGLLATEYTPEHLINEVEVENHKTILHFVNKENPLAPIPENPENDPQYLIWQNAIDKWFNNLDEENLSFIPTEYDDIHLPEYKPKINILEPSSNANIYENQLAVGLAINSTNDILKTDYYINGVLWHNTNSWSKLIIKDIGFLPNGAHQLTITSCDLYYNCQSEDRFFNLNRENNNFDLSEISAKINYPPNNSILNQVDLPLNVQISIQNEGQVADIKMFIEKKENNNQIELRKEVNYSFIINKELEGGQYLLYGYLYNWLGQKTAIEPINIVIN
jgi:1A family penicillin-binding protein